MILWPLNRKYRNLLTVAAYLWVVVIFVLCLLPADEMPIESGIPHFDKIAHFGVYMVLTVLCMGAFSETRYKYATETIIAIIFGIGLTVEIMQKILPFGRNFSELDMVANVAGIAAGLLLFKVIRHTCLRLSKPDSRKGDS